MEEHGLADVGVADPDRQVWVRQRAGQRSADKALLRIATAPSALATVIAATEACDGTLVGRAALGQSFVEVEPAAVTQLRERLPAGCTAVLADGPPSLRAQADPWGLNDGPALELMRRVKARFDPAGTCNPGLYVGGI
jgi:FAD/FMN-containing dehydrogenase